jgi:hypothetical protein
METLNEWRNTKNLNQTLRQSVSQLSDALVIMKPTTEMKLFKQEASEKTNADT